ncbi:unnamed protein product [Parnassius mnemosyne]|uniref:NADP-dependent oxidoreductase domain-containing protein n=1 Tax=Parnassius mnemosyne TaxID=213953 RepID=A0AAV1L0K8_9NEOP
MVSMKIRARAKAKVLINYFLFILTEKEMVESKRTRTRIPTARFRQAIDKIKKERRERMATDKEQDIPHSSNQKSSIPRLKGSKSPPPFYNKEINAIKKEEYIVTSKADEEFDKIFQEMGQTDDTPSLETISNKIENVNELESTFEEIMHAYEGNKEQPLSIDKIKQSKIPLLKRTSIHEIEVPNNRERATLKKSISIDTPIISTTHEENNTHVGEKTIVTSEEIRRTNTQTKTTTERFVLQNVSSYTNNYMITRNYDTNTDNNVNNGVDTLALARTTAILNESDSQYQGSAKDETKESVKVAIPVFDLSVPFDKNIGNKINEETITRVNKSKENFVPETSLSEVQKGHTMLRTNDIEEPGKTYEIKPVETILTSSHVQVNINEKETKIHNENIGSYKIESEVIPKIHTTSTNEELGYETQKEVSTKTNEKRTKTNYMTKNITEQNLENSMEEDIPILRGKVNRIIRRMSSNGGSKPHEKDSSESLPNKKTILSKIAMFEHNEPNEPFPISRIPKLEHKISLGLRTQRQTSQEVRRPIIVREVLKDSSESRSPKTNEYSTFKCTEQEENKNVKSSDTSSHKTLNNDILENGITAIATLERYNYKPVKRVVNDIEDAAKDSIAIHAFKSEVNTTEASIGNETDNSSLNNSKQTIIKNNIFELKDDSRFDIIQTNNNIKNVTEILNSDALNNLHNDFNSSLELESTKTTYKYETCNLSEKSDKKITKVNTDYVFNFTPVGKTLDEILTRHNNTIVNIVEEKRKTFDALVDLSSVNKDQSEEKIATQQYNEVITQKIEERNKMEHKIKEFSSREEDDIRRTTSVAELDFGNVIKGKVHKMIMRIKSIERAEHGKRQIIISETERPRKSSVSEKIALFEGKLSPSRPEKTTDLRKKVNKTDVLNSQMDEEAYRKKIGELLNAKTNYGAINATYHELRDGSSMPVIALGTALLDKRLIKHVVEAAIDLGYRAFDTAYIYGNEREVGEAIKKKIEDGSVKREDLFIISKLWSTFHRRDLVEEACRNSLQTMGLAYFDLFLIHNPMSLKEGKDPIPKIANVLQFSEHDYMDAWYGIEDLISKGLVRRGGVSNFNSEQVHRVIEKGQLKPVINQVECQPYLSQDRLAGFCDAYGIKLNCFGVLGSKGTPAELKSGLSPVIDDPLVLVMAAGLGITPAQLLVAYQLHQGRSVVVKCSSAAHLHDSLAAQRVQLDTTHIIALNALNRNKRTFTFKGLGETHKNYPFNIAF